MTAPQTRRARHQWTEEPPARECEATFTLDRQIARAREEMGEAKWRSFKQNGSERMTEISEAAKARACELTNANGGATYHPTNIGPETPRMYAFARFIQQVSDAAKEVDAELNRQGFGDAPACMRARLDPFILPEPVDPLEEAIAEAMNTELPANEGTRQGMARLVRERLAKRGLKIVEADQ